MPQRVSSHNDGSLPATAAVLWVTPIPVILLEATGRLLYVNPAAAAVFDESPENLSGRPMPDTPLPAALGVDAGDLAAMARTLSPPAVYHDRNGTVYRFTARVVDPAATPPIIGLFGRDITSLHQDSASVDSARASLEELIEERTSALVEANEKFRRQINERLKVERALRASEEKYRSIFDNIQDVYAEVSKDGIIMEVSPSVGNLFLYARDELLGASINTIYADPAEREKVTAAIARDGGVKNREIRLRDKDGSVHHCLVTSRMVTDESGAPVKTVTSLRDINTLKKTEAELERTRESLYQAQKMKALGTLVAGVAHEINNPVNLILFNLPLFRDLWQEALPVLTRAAENNALDRIGGLPLDYLEKNLGQLIEDTEMAAKRIATIVGNLKDFYRRSETRDMAPMNLNTAIENALRLAGTSMRKAGVAVSTSLSPELPDITGNLQGVEQICLNMLLNAAEAIDHGDGCIEVASGKVSGGRIFFSVSDNGKGISPEIEATIFDPFVTDKQAEGGTGLGLSVSYSLVQAHRGEIRAEPRAGGGSVFTVTFPTAAQFRSAKIMLIDDDDMLLEYIETSLNQQTDYQVLALSGLEACLRLGTYRPDLVVLDVFMPEVDGLEICQIMKKDPVLADIPVIITTGQPDHPVVEEIKKLGFSQILEKPLHINTLIAAIEQALHP